MIALGVDVGTTGVKTVAITGDGRMAAAALREHDLICRHPGWAEEDPADWWRNVALSLRDIWDQGVDPAQVAAVGVSGMVPAIVCPDGHGEPVRLAILMNDARAAAELAEVVRRLDPQEVSARTGSYLNLQHILPRLLWVRRHEPHAFARTRRVLGSYDYVAGKLAGTASLEANWAVESGLWDVHREAWIPEYLAVLGLPEDAFPPVNRPLTRIGGVTREAAAATGLRPGTPVIAGSADHVASALAAGLRQSGDLLIKFGGSGDVLYCTDRRLTHKKPFFDLHDIPGLYILNGCMAAGGSLVKWFVRQCAAEWAADPQVYARLDAEAEAVPPGSEGLVVLPYFLGEKTPLFDPAARGVFFGLTLSHTRGPMFRAILEAVILGFRHRLEVLAAMGEAPRRVVATNGGVKSRLWRQIAADALGFPVTSFRDHPGACLGAAFLAGMAGGLFSRWTDIDLFLQDTYVSRPDPARRAAYDLNYRLYRQVYEHLRPSFDLLQRGGP